MAVKTFTTEVLTSADTNTYLANSGLVYVSSTTVGTTVSSVTVSSAFSTTYDAYQIIWTGGLISADTSISVVLGSSVTGYYGNYTYANYGNTSVASANDNNGSKFSIIGGGDPFNGSSCMFILNNPFVLKQTYVFAFGVAYSTFNGTYNGRKADANSYTAFTLAPASGTMTGGTITVYGYRKA